jgi:ketosteroid isomerase-like protein
MTTREVVLDEAQQAAATQDQAEKVLRLIGDEAQFDLYADDIVMEFPYGASLGMPDRFEGKKAVVDYARELFRLIPDLKMRDMHYSSVAGDPNTVFIEYVSDIATPGGHTYRQIYVNKMQFRDGLLVHMREFWDPKRILDARSGLLDQEQAS